MPLLRLLLNILWSVTGGVWMAALWLLTAVIMVITIVGIPWARAAFNIALYTLLAFGQTAVNRADYTGWEDIEGRAARHDRQSNVARAGGMVARLRPLYHRTRSGDQGHRTALRLGANRGLQRRDRLRAIGQASGSVRYRFLTKGELTSRRS